MWAVTCSNSYAKARAFGANRLPKALFTSPAILPERAGFCAVALMVISMDLSGIEIKPRNRNFSSPNPPVKSRSPPLVSMIMRALYFGLFFDETQVLFLWKEILTSFSYFS